MKMNNKFSLKLVMLGLSLAVLPRISFGVEPVNEDEWYDPSDWFDNNNVESDDTYDYIYDPYGYDYYDGYWDGLSWYDYYDSDYPYGVDYVWDPTLDEWVAYENFDYDLDYDYSDTGSQSQSSGSAQSKSNQQTLKGTVNAFTRIDQSDSTGVSLEHAVARIELENGRTAVVDLGLASLYDAELKKGDEVTLRGQKGEINGRSVFVADQFTANGETAYINRAFEIEMRSQIDRGSRGKTDRQYSAKQRMDEDKSGNSSSMTQKKSGKMQGHALTLDGTIERVQTVKLQGEDERQRLAKITLQNGKAATVNLGSDLSAEKLGLEEGDKVRIHGTTKKYEGRTVLMAESIKIHTDSKDSQSRDNRSGSAG